LRNRFPKLAKGFWVAARRHGCLSNPATTGGPCLVVTATLLAGAIVTLVVSHVITD
jgi:hypothetical protein